MKTRVVARKTGFIILLLMMTFLFTRSGQAQGPSLRLFDAQVITVETVSRHFSVATSSTTDVQLYIEQPATPNPVTIWLQLSNDGVLFSNKYLLASNVDSTVSLISRQSLFGNFARVRVIPTNSEPVVVTVIISIGSRLLIVPAVPTFVIETPQPTETTVPTETPEPPTPTFTSTPTDTPTPEPSNTPGGATSTPTFTPTATPTHTPTETSTATPVDTATFTPEPTATGVPPPPTPTFTPTATPTTAAIAPCTHTITPHAARWTVDSRQSPYTGIGPGSVICLQNGTHAGLTFKVIRGTAANPITIRNNGGVATINNVGSGDGLPAIAIEYSTHFRLTGTGHAGTEYGIVLRGETQGMRVRFRSDHMEIDHLHVADAQITAINVFPAGGTEAQWANTYGALAPFPTIDNYTQVGIHIHHNLIQQSGAVTQASCISGHQINQSMYIGNAIHDPPFPPYINEISIHHNIAKNNCNEGIQVTWTKPTNPVCRIWSNYVENDSVKVDLPGQVGSIFVRNNTSCQIDGNIIVNGNSHGIKITGPNGSNVKSRIFNNIIVRSGSNHPNDLDVVDAAAILSGVDHNGDARDGEMIAHNTIIDPVNEIGIYLSNPSANMDMYNNLIVGATTPYQLGSGAGHTVLPSQAGTTFASASGLAFLNTTQPEGNNYYDIGAGSAAMNKSANNSQVGPDFEGKTRPFPGSSFDLGAYEFYNVVPTPTFTPTPTPTATNTPVGPTPTFTPTPTPTNTGEPVSQQLILQPDAAGIDTYVNEASPTVGAANGATLVVRGEAGQRRIAYLRFDLSSIANKTVVSGEFSLWNETVHATESYTFTLHRVTTANSDFTESAKWAFVDGAAARWAGDTGADGGTDAGGSIAATDYNTGAMATLTYVANTAQATQHTVTLGLVQLQNAVNAGVLEIEIIKTSTGGFSWRSSDHAASTTRPQLVITYLP